MQPKKTPAGPTPTSTPTATVPPPAPFNSASFVYDGDGKRVKSVFNSTTTTYFVGAHYEVTGSTITKYYYAGSQRIAMRTNGTLNYLLGDHLGSTSLTTNASGQIVSELRYKAWGETRYASGNAPTKYQYTGQFSYESDFGLMFYNARWYDSYLNHFTQPDSIIPQGQGVQAWDRYAYANNNPVRYTDPTGHKPCDGDFDEKGDCDDSNYKLLDLLDYVEGEIVNKNGKIKDKYISLQAMLLVVKKAASIYGRDWNGFLDATTYVFTGYYGHGSESMLRARQSDFKGYFDGDSGFNLEFQDGDNQVRHFWAAFATAANPTGDNPFGGLVAGVGNDYHDIVEDWLGVQDTTIIDYTLSWTAINIADQVGKDQIPTSSALAGVLSYGLGVNGPGSNGYRQLLEKEVLWIWTTPYK